MMMMGGATRQLVREGEGRARQEINNIERQVFPFINSPAMSVADVYFWLNCICAGVATGKHSLQRAGSIFRLLHIFSPKCPKPETYLTFIYVDIVGRWGRQTLPA